MLEMPTATEKKSVSADLKERAIAMKAEGMTQTAIANALGIGQATVSRHLK